MAEIVTVTYTPTEICYSARAEDYFALPGTIVSGQTLLKGTIVGLITASNKLKAYADVNQDGSEVAVGVLVAAVDAAAGDKPCSFFIQGIFVEAKLTGLDAAAKSDLSGRSCPNGVFKF